AWVALRTSPHARSAGSFHSAVDSAVADVLASALQDDQVAHLASPAVAIHLARREAHPLRVTFARALAVVDAADVGAGAIAVAAAGAVGGASRQQDHCPAPEQVSHEALSKKRDRGRGPPSSGAKAWAMPVNSRVRSRKRSRSGRPC